MIINRTPAGTPLPRANNYRIRAGYSPPKAAPATTSVRSIVPSIPSSQGRAIIFRAPKTLGGGGYHAPSLPPAHHSSYHLPTIPTYHVPTLPTIPTYHVPTLPPKPAITPTPIPSVPRYHVPMSTSTGFFAGLLTLIDNLIKSLGL